MTSAAGTLPDNIVYFSRALRRAGVPVGTAQILEALRAVAAVGFTNRLDFHTTLRAMIVSRADHLLVFDQVFAMFWRDPEFLENMITNLLPVITAPPVDSSMEPAQTRAAEAMASGGGKPRCAPQQEQLDLPKVLGRRHGLAANAVQIDRRRALQSARRSGGEMIHLPKRRAKPRRLNLVVLCDISGSMTSYSRMMMHFVHSVAQVQGQSWATVHGFTFGTRLHNISPLLTIKDPDAALRAIGSHVRDWEGGTRIASSLRDFNRHWARRVLSTPSVVLLITDGLEREGIAKLESEMARMALQTRELIWLNPLLRWGQFSPQAAGIRAMLPYVSSFVACHNLDSLQELSDSLKNGLHADHKKRLIGMLK